MTTFTPTWRPTLADLKPLKPAEEQLIAGCRTGELVVLDASVPEVATKGNEVRGALIRYLLLGGCDEARPHPRGMRVSGAFVSGVLDFEACRSDLVLVVIQSRFETAPQLMDCHLDGLFLNGSDLPGLQAARMQVARDVALRSGFRCGGPVILRGARIGGQLACIGGRFEAAQGVALNCDALTVGADVFLSDGFVATGPVNLGGARIGGQLACSGGRFEAAQGVALDCDALTVGADVFLSGGFVATGPVSLIGAQIGGQLACVGGRFEAATGVALDCEAATIGSHVLLRQEFYSAGPVDLNRARIGGSLAVLNADLNGRVNFQGMSVTGTFVFQVVTGDIAFLDLMDATVGRLRDDVDSWKTAKIIQLTDFRYDALDGGTSVRQRLDWLARNHNRNVRTRVGDQAAGQDFDPQAYTHLAQVFDAQGHRRSAARVLYEREVRLRRAEHRRAHARIDGTAEAGWNSVLADARRGADGVFGLLFGYGHRPMRALAASALIVLLGGWLYGAVYTAGQMAPNSDVVLTSAEWPGAVSRDGACPPTTDAGHAAALAVGCDMPLATWLAGETAKDYETFNRWLYGLDLFLPLFALGQEAAWAPSKDRGALGYWGYYLRWAFQMAGWIITALGAAVLTGLVGRKD